MFLNIYIIDLEILNGMEEKCIELLIDGIAERKKYKLKDENLLKAIGRILKNLSENEGVKQIIQVRKFFENENDWFSFIREPPLSFHKKTLLLWLNFWMLNIRWYEKGRFLMFYCCLVYLLLEDYMRDNDVYGKIDWLSWYLLRAYMINKIYNQKTFLKSNRISINLS